MTSVTALVVIFRPPLPLQPQPPPPQCQPVTWELPLAQSGFNWKLNEREGDVRGPSLDSERTRHPHPECATPSLATPPAGRGYCSRTGHGAGTEEAEPGWEAGEGQGGATVPEGGQAGDKLCLLNPMPTHHEPAATPALAMGRSPPVSLSVPRSPRPVRSGALAWGCRQRAREGARGRAGDTREAGLGGGPWSAPPAPCPPSRSSRLGGQSCGCPRRARLPPRTAPTCRVRGAPPPRTPILSPPETSRLATRVSHRRRWDPGTGRRARSW